jgi:hypothetical protein
MVKLGRQLGIRKEGSDIVSRLGPPFCGRVQSLCDGLGAEAFKISAPRFRPPDKDDAVPRVRKADGGDARAARSVQRTGAGEALKFRPLDFGPPIKMMRYRG